MAEPTMPAELWMFRATSDGSSRWLVSIDECSGADDLYLVATSEETAKRVAKEQAETYFDGQEGSVIPVRIRPTPGPATKAMLGWIRTSNRELSFGPPAALTKAFFAEWDNA